MPEPAPESVLDVFSLQPGASLCPPCSLPWNRALSGWNQRVGFGHGKPHWEMGGRTLRWGYFFLVASVPADARSAKASNALHGLIDSLPSPPLLGGQGPSDQPQAVTLILVVSLHALQASVAPLVDSPYGAFAISFLTQASLCQGALLIVIRATIYRETSAGSHFTCVPQLHSYSDSQRKVSPLFR